MAALQAQGVPAVFTLSSGLGDIEPFVTALPHGIYASASLELIVQAFGLKRQTPHNFLVLRPDHAADTEQGGVRASPRQLPYGPAVAFPQLTQDFFQLGGRGRDQAEALCDLWGKQLPTLDEASTP
jgi:hypothetical protein